MSGTDRLDQSASQPDPISDEERERMGREAAARKQLASVCYEQAREACDELRYQLEQMRRAESDRLAPRYDDPNPHPEYQQGQPRADGPDLSVKIETRDNPFLGQPHADEPEPGQAQRAGALYDGLDDLAVALQTGLGLVGLTHMNLRHGARAVLEKAGVEKLLDELEDLRSDVASDNAEFDAIATSLGIRDAKGGYETDKLAPHVKQLKARAEKAERELTRVNEEREHYLGWLEAQIRWDLRELCEISIQLVSQSAIARWEREQYTERLYAIRDRNKPEGG